MNKHIIKNIPECSTVTELNKNGYTEREGKNRFYTVTWHLFETALRISKLYIMNENIPDVNWTEWQIGLEYMRGKNSNMAFILKQH